jgi:hypothetical protein
LELFYEFYWRVVMAHFDVPADQVDASWRDVAKQSERQLGAYIACRLLITNSRATIPNTNTHVSFRNRVIHQGYIPKPGEAIRFGDFVLDLVRNELQLLRQKAPVAVGATYDRLSPTPPPDDNDDESLVGGVNVLTSIDVRHPPKADDLRCGGVEAQLARVPRDRQPHGLELLTSEAMDKYRREHRGD